MRVGVGESEPLLESGFQDIHLVLRKAKAQSGMGCAEQPKRMGGTHLGGPGSWRAASNSLLMVGPSRTVYSEAFFWDRHLLLPSPLKETVREKTDC